MDRRCAFYWFDLNNGAVRNRLQFYELLSVMQGEANDRLLCELAAARHGDIPPVLDVGVARIHGSKHGAPGIGAYDLVEALFLPQFSLKSAQESVSSSAAAAQYNCKNARQLRVQHSRNGRQSTGICSRSYSVQCVWSSWTPFSRLLLPAATHFTCNTLL